ncbi:MAG: hypothetical protein K1X54_01655 [Flavobacteriales bacterium]|nr:hypothetical protein [Flavobacteriales bacterium]
MKSLRYILGIFALISLFTACTKDADLLAPASESQYFEEKKASDSEDGDIPGKPGGGSDAEEGLASDAGSTSGQTGDPDDSGISDDDDDESDDDSSTRSK